MKKIMYFLLIILLIVLIAISSYFIYKQLKEENEQESIFNNLSEIIQDDTENRLTDNLKSNNYIKIQELYKENNDLIGWINIEDTNIDYPVMQTKNNEEYYLRKNFYKKYSSYGTPFLSSSCNIDTSENLIVYGHHMQNSKMFGELENYKKEDFYKSHKYINFYTLEADIKYEIFAVFRTTLYKNNTFKYYQNIELDNEEDYTRFINKCYELSYYDTGIKPNFKEKLITLSTCDYTTKNSRLVVVAREIIGE